MFQNVMLTIAVACAQALYACFKVLPVTNKLVMLSRQSDRPSRDFALFAQAWQQQHPDYRVIMLCNTVRPGALGALAYAGVVLRQMLHLATARICVLDSYAVPVSILNHRHSLVIVQMWHALGAVKKFGYQCLDTPEGRSSRVARVLKMHRNYDCVLCGGEASRQIFAEAFNVPPDKVLPIGLPRMDFLLAKAAETRTPHTHAPQQAPAPQQAATSELPTSTLDRLAELPGSGTTTILYAPTFRKGQAPQFDAVARAFADGPYVLVVKPHDLDSSFSEQDNVIDATGTSVMSLLPLVDVVITDYSAIVFEAALINKPVYFFVPDIDDYEHRHGLNINPLQVFPTLASRNITEIAEWIASGTFDRAAFDAAMQPYVCAPAAGATERLITTIEQLQRQKSRAQNTKTQDTKSLARQIKTLGDRIVSPSPALRSIVRLMLHGTRKARYWLTCATNQVDPSLVIFECYAGRNYSCSPRAIYQALLEDPMFADCTFVWAFRESVLTTLGNPAAAERVFGEAALQELSHAQIVRHGSGEYHRLHARAGYWIANYIVPTYLFVRRGQTYVQTWHGTPLKRLGCDIAADKTSAMFKVNEIHQRYIAEGKRFSWLVSPSPYASEKLSSAFGLSRERAERVILETGYPRNDILRTFMPGDAAAVKRRLGIPDNKTVVLYAPTFRDDQRCAGLGYTLDTGIDLDAFVQEFGGTHVLLFRAHYLVASQIDFTSFGSSVINVSDISDVNDLYIVSDMLVTDYSSVFFDYANLLRPIIFYPYDAEHYANDLRGFYLDTSDLPGPIVSTQAALFEAIHDASQVPVGTKGAREHQTTELRITTAQERSQQERLEALQAFRSRFAPLDDGQAARRAIAAAFGR